MTNFEKIKNMSVDEIVNKLDKVLKNMNIEEMADNLDGIFTCELCPIEVFCHKNRKIITCKTVWEKWLKSEVQNNDISKS